MLTIRRKFDYFGAVLVLVSGTTAGLGLMGVSDLSKSLSDGVILTKSLHYQSDADMMHDALRGDVYQALHAARENPGLRAEIEASLADNLKQFNSDVQRNLELS